MMNTKGMLGGVAAVAMAFSGAVASAQTGAIGAETLAAMGLEGAQVVSDSVAYEVRGQGFLPFSVAGGGSFAYIGGRRGQAASVNGYLAAGRYSAQGENFSEAGKTVRTVNVRQVGRRSVRRVNVKSVNVYAGGFSSSSSF